MYSFKNVLLLITLLFSKIGFAMSSMPPASHFFKGQQLEIALAIDKSDADLAGSLAKKIGHVELDRPGTEGMTLLTYAANKAISESPKHLEVVKALIRSGADPLTQAGGQNGGSILSIALLRAEGGAGPSFLLAVLDAGVSPNSLEYRNGGAPIIFRMTSQDTPECLHLLVERGADVNIKSKLGRTAIFYGLDAFALDEVNYLLDHGANPDVVDVYGNSFASKLKEKVDTQQNDPRQRYPKILALRDRVIKMGVQWPPVSSLEERERMRARGVMPRVPFGLEK